VGADGKYPKLFAKSITDINDDICEQTGDEQSYMAAEETHDADM